MHNLVQITSDILKENLGQQTDTVCTVYISRKNLHPTPLFPVARSSGIKTRGSMQPLEPP